MATKLEKKLNEIEKLLDDACLMLQDVREIIENDESDEDEEDLDDELEDEEFDEEDYIEDDK